MYELDKELKYRIGSFRIVKLEYEEQDPKYIIQRYEEEEVGGGYIWVNYVSAKYDNFESAMEALVKFRAATEAPIWQTVVYAPEPFNPL